MAKYVYGERERTIHHYHRSGESNPSTGDMWDLPGCFTPLAVVGMFIVMAIIAVVFLPLLVTVMSVLVVVGVPVMLVGGLVWGLFAAIFE
ncbi:MAG: hypothetical protein H7831_08355 [Magnetococcus sp. WYHC-3]